MKKILIFLLSIFSVFALAGCGDTNKEPSPTPDIPKEKYTISFYDENGQLLEAKEYEKNALVTYSYEPKDTKEYDYSLKGWLAENSGEVITALPKATKTVNYYASLTKVKNKYRVSFNTNGGNEISAISLEYGSKVEEPAKPTKAGYRFMGWFLDSGFTKKAEFPLEIKDNLELYALWQEEVKVLDYLKSLLKGYRMDPWSYIPDNLKPSSHLENNIIASYDNFTNVSSIKTGYGEEWAMILDNISQSELFYKALEVIEGLSSASIVAYNNYLDTNPSDVNAFSFKSGIYLIAIKFKDNIISYNVSFSGNIPVIGDTTISLTIGMDITTGIRTGIIRAGEANALKYIVSENSYTFAIKYLNSREAYFEVRRDDNGNVAGKIYEFLHLKDKNIASSTAEFYIVDGFLSALGNKASGIPGFNGYILELYKIESGKLLGYEVKESIDIKGKEVEFNTLWFNLSDILGINNIKAIKPEKPSGSNPHNIFINNSQDIFKVEKFGGLNLQTLSRRYDIEMRKTYLYQYDSEKEKNVRVEALVPMLFIQEEKLTEFSSDVKKNNGIDLSVNLSDIYLNRLMNDYDNLIPEFIKNKNNITKEKIIEFIG